jgi:H+/Cl- antiporter ClcA
VLTIIMTLICIDVSAPGGIRTPTLGLEAQQG